METTLRNADLQALSDMLRDQQTRKVDAVAPAASIRSEAGELVLAGLDAEITAEGVTQVDGRYQPTGIAIEGIAEKLNVPVTYLRRLHAQRPDLFDANVNGWLHGGDFGRDGVEQPGERYAEPDGRSFLVRTFRGDDGGTGLARAFLSDRWFAIDHLDALVAAMTGVRESGVDVQVTQCDLTERRMYVKVAAPAVAALASSLLAGYRSPFTGDQGADNPTVFAGFLLTNSETGDGSMALTPQITVQICGNGMTITRDAMRKVHLGTRLDHGVVRWSADTQRRALELVTAEARDAVATFLDVDYVTRKIAELEEKAGVKVHRPDHVIQTVTKSLSYSEAQANDVLRMYIDGAQSTAGGVMHAVTAAAQVQANADTAAAMEADAFRALELAATAAR